MPIDHVVKQGECLSRIASQYGFADYKAIYNHPDNADLKQKRPNPNVLRPGDVVHVPDLEKKKVDASTGQSYKFRVNLPKKALRLVLLDASGKPVKGEDYRLEAGPDVLTGQTDGDGKIEVKVAATAGGGRLTIAGRILVLNFGDLNPVDRQTDDPDDEDWSGVQARLKNLGYDVGPTDGDWGARTRAALALFQHDHDLEIDGKPSDATLKKLEEAHGS
jgi:N-acetylmuramoyl-L-alanine amidase